MAATGTNAETRGNQSPPFSIDLLNVQVKTDTDAPQGQKQRLLSLLPASIHTDSDDIVVASRHVSACLAQELDLRRLDNVFDWLWVVGRPMPPRPLHHQLLLGREPFVTEQMDMHLVWTTGQIFLKPIPRFLLDPAFWAEYISCRPGCGCSDDGECERPKLGRCALGFLFSYAALLRRESDFLIAKEKHLLPAEAQWPAWRTLVEQLDTERIYPRIHRRFFYGELRLSRLNKIYVLSRRPFLRSYMPHWQQYATFFQQSFAWLAAAIVYIAIVLTAMQVGLATKTLSDNDAFQSASYGFTVFSILGPLAATAIIRKKRFRQIQARPAP